MSTIKTEGTHAGEFLLSEASGSRSREEDVLAATAVDLPAGQVLGRLTATDELVPYDDAGDDGSEEAVAILFAPKPASEDEQRATVIARDAEVIRTRLVGLDADSEAALHDLGIIVREGTA